MNTIEKRAIGEGCISARAVFCCGFVTLLLAGCSALPAPPTRATLYDFGPGLTSYAPADHPEVVVTVLLEHTGGGGAFAAPVAKEMLAAYFDKSIVAASLPPPQIRPDMPTGWGGYED